MRIPLVAANKKKTYGVDHIMDRDRDKATKFARKLAEVLDRVAGFAVFEV